MEESRERLRRAGLRATGPRLAVLEALAGAEPHVTAEAVAKAIRVGRSISTQGVYDSLGALVAVGLVRRIEPAGHPTRYELRVRDNHHHLVCRGCGRTEDVDCTVGSAPCLIPVDDAGFVIDEAEVTFWGLCPACRPPNSTER